MNRNILDRERLENWGGAEAPQSSIRESEARSSAFSGGKQKRVAAKSVDTADRSKQQGASGISHPARYNLDHLVAIANLTQIPLKELISNLKILKKNNIIK